MALALPMRLIASLALIATVSGLEHRELENVDVACDILTPGSGCNQENRRMLDPDGKSDGKGGGDVDPSPSPSPEASPSPSPSPDMAVMSRPDESELLTTIAAASCADSLSADACAEV